MRRAVWAVALIATACATPGIAPGEPELLAPGLISTDASEWNATFTANGRSAVFARSPEADFENAGIWTTEQRGAGWTPPRPIGFTTPGRTDSDPQISSRGDQLLFVSNRPAGSPSGAPGKRDLDIWSSTLSGGRWSDPRPLPTVNGPGPELGPEIHGDVLYFNTVRRGGPGALDIWSAPISGALFGEPEPLPAPLNSAASEGDFTLHPSGSLALFWSDRPGGLGEGDIYLSVRSGDAWGSPVNLGASVNSAAFDFTPSFSADRRWLIFSSMRLRDGVNRRSDIYRIRVESVPALRNALARR